MSWVAWLNIKSQDVIPDTDERSVFSVVIRLQGVEQLYVLYNDLYDLYCMVSWWSITADVYKTVITDQ